MKLLLDTHVLWWVVDSPEKISSKPLEIITDRRNWVYFSSASIWELAIKTSKGMFKLDDSLVPSLLGFGYSELSVRYEHALAVGKLPFIHRDPFDRLLVVQAQLEDMVLVTSDKQVLEYGCRTICA